MSNMCSSIAAFLSVIRVLYGIVVDARLLAGFSVLISAGVIENNWVSLWSEERWRDTWDFAAQRTGS